MTTTRNHDDKKGLSLQAAAFRSRSESQRQAAPSAFQNSLPMDKSNAFLIKNLLSPGDLLAEHPDQLQQQAMMMMQMKLAFEWLSQLQQPEAQSFQFQSADSATFAAPQEDSRPPSVDKQHHWDLKADGEQLTAFRPVAKADCQPTFCFSRNNKKQLLLHRIIGLMVPQFRPSVATSDCAHSSFAAQFAQERVKVELPLTKFPVQPFNPNSDTLQRFCTLNNQFQSDGVSLKSSIEQNRKDDKGEKRRKRTTFTQEQLNALEHEFQSKKYLTLEERAAIADTLGLSQVQIKIWWQNRRASYKRSKICLVTSSPGDAESSTSEKMQAVASADSRPKIVVPIPVHVSRRMTVQHGKNTSTIGRGLPTATPNGFAFGMF